MVPTIAALDASGVTAARVALIATFVGMLFSTSLGVGLEVVVYVLFAGSPTLRKRLWQTGTHPAALALAAFLLTVALGTLYGEASWETRMRSLFAWRKALLFFFASAVFDADAAKKEFLSAVFAASLLAALLSFGLYVAQLRVFGSAPGIILHNDVTQSLIFAVAAAIAASTLLYPAKVVALWIPKSRTLLGLAGLVLVGNVAFVTPSRSGYLSLVVLAAVFSSVLWARGGKYRAAAALAPILCVAVVLASSGQVRTRLSEAVAELRKGGGSQQMTSMGVRTVMWGNAYQMIQAHPLSGVGTGSFEVAYGAIVRGRNGWQAEVTTDPHNQFLKVRAEQGIAGLLALLGFIGTALMSKAAQPYRLLAAAILLVWCATSLFSSHFSTFVEGRFLFCWLGVMFARPIER